MGSLKRFRATGLFLYPLKTSENIWFSDVFRGYRKRLVACNGLNDKKLIEFNKKHRNKVHSPRRWRMLY